MLNFDIDLQWFLIFSAIIVAGALAFLSKKLDLPGTIAGMVLALVIWIGTGTPGLVALLIFFVAGSLASAFRKSAKMKIGVAEARGGMRGLPNVMANGGAAGIASILAIISPADYFLYQTMVIASFAAACSDTFSSEFGNIFGSKYFDILSFKKSTRGPDGVVSFEGFGFGVLGSLIIAFPYYLYIRDFQLMTLIALCGFAGNVLDSIFGATIQRRGLVNNHQVNFLATTLGMLILLLTMS